MAEENKNKAYALAGYIGGGIITLIGLVLGFTSGWVDTTWYTIGVGVLCIVAGLAFQFGLLEPDGK